MQIESTLSYDDVAQTWRGIVHDGRSLTYQSTCVAAWRERWERLTGFSGATVAQMTEWVDHGRLAPGMAVTSTSDAATRTKIRWNDFDGELDVERLLDGDDRPFSLRERRKQSRGLTLRIQYNFLAEVDAQTLADYAQWCAELIAGLQGQAFDLQIDVFSSVRMAIRGQSARVTTNVRVKRFGKRSSLKSWGALFSPAGYRMLGFTARMMACSEHKVACHTGMGSSIADGWNVTLEDRTLTVTCSANSGTFPGEYMDGKLAALKI